MVLWKEIRKFGRDTGLEEEEEELDFYFYFILDYS